MTIAKELALIDLSLGEIVGGPNKDTKRYLAEIAKKDWQGYVKAPGIERLRVAIAKRFQDIYEPPLSSEHVLVTTGASLGLTAIYTLVPNKQLLIPNISFPLYRKTTALLGVQTEPYHIGPMTDWERTLSEIEAGFQRGVLAVLWNNPHNPLGKVAPHEVVERLSFLCQKYKALCISDEVYRDFTLGEKIVSPASFIPFQTVFLYSFSKSYAMAGARVGFVIAHPAIIRQMTSVHWCLGMSTPWLAQEAAYFSLDYEPHYPVKLSDTIGKRLRWASSLLKAKDIIHYEPEGGVFLCLSASSIGIRGDEFVIRAREDAKLLLMSGREFGDSNLVRVSAGIDDSLFEEAIYRLVDLCHTLNGGEENK